MNTNQNCASARNTTDKTPIVHNETREVFNWSTRNKVGEFWRTFFYCPGAEFNTGRSVYYGRNDWRNESDAVAAQQRWEKRNPVTTENQTYS